MHRSTLALSICLLLSGCVSTNLNPAAKYGVQSYSESLIGDLGHIGDIELMNDSTIVLVGYTSPFYQPKKKRNPDGKIIAISPDGSLKWVRQFGGLSGDGLRSVSITPDDNIVAVGVKSSNQRDRADGWHISTDKDGHLLWEKTFDLSSWQPTLDVFAENTGEILAVGRFINTNTEQERGASLFKLDANGEVILRREYVDSETRGFLRIISVDANEIIVLAEIEPEGEKSSRAVIHLSNSGEKIETTFVPPLRKGFSDRSYVEKAGKSQLAVLSQNSFADIPQDRTVLRLLDYNGEEIWRRSIARDTSQYMRGLASHQGLLYAILSYSNEKPFSFTQRDNVRKHELVCVSTKGEILGRQDIFDGHKVSSPATIVDNSGIVNIAALKLDETNEVYDLLVERTACNQ